MSAPDAQRAGDGLLVLDAARVEPAHAGPGRARGSGLTLSLALALAPGEAAMVQVADPAQGALLADACAGVVRPTSGAVRFLGQDWAALDDEEANALRALVGRVFHDGGWLDHLGVADNVLLALRHHSRLPEQRLLSEAARLARRFGLVGLPTGAVARLERAALQRAACVRAFLGQPRLVILEHPTAGAYPALVAPLADAMRAVRERGAAVLWLTSSEVVWRDASIPVSRRVRLLGTGLVEAGAAP